MFQPDTNSTRNKAPFCRACFNSGTPPTETEDAWSVTGKVLWLSSFESQAPFYLCFISCGNQIFEAQVSRNGFQSPSRYVLIQEFLSRCPQQQWYVTWKCYSYIQILWHSRKETPSVSGRMQSWGLLLQHPHEMEESEVQELWPPSPLLHDMYHFYDGISRQI